MCGICGILYDDYRAVDPGILERMVQTLAPRGPDAAGTWHGPGIALGHRRLKVLDLEGAAQPMVAADADVCLVYNGEIYNYRELGADLRSLGHTVSLRSDTEVLLRGYLQWGAGVVERCNGMFAFAVWDGRDRTLLLARDRMGQKPLYLARLPHGLLFASELKAILTHPDFESRVDADSLRRYLVHEYVPDPHCIVCGASKVPPAHLAVVRSTDLAVRPRAYWDLSFPAAGSGRQRRMRLEDTAEELRFRLGRAARRRMMSDVPLGVFLSGGIDSSLVVGLLSGDGGSPDALETFAIGFGDPTFDESAHAARVARRFSTHHRSRRFDLDELMSVLPRVTAQVDEPFGDASVLPTHLLSRFTREHVTVTLSGDGGDELFAGYPTFQAERVGAPMTRYLGSGWHGLLRRAAGLLPVSTDNISLDFKVKQFLRGVGLPAEARHQVWLGSFTPAEARALLQPEVASRLGHVDPLDEVSRLVDRTPTSDPWDRLMVFYCRYYLAGDILVKVDRATMAVGLEARAPFLDPEVVDLACRIPPAHRLRGFETKAVCRRLARDLLPASIVRRPKKGFGIPVAQWLKGPLRGLMTRLLDPARLRREGFFRPEPVSDLVQGHLAGRVDARKPLWTLMAFGLWLEEHGPGAAP